MTRLITTALALAVLHGVFPVSVASGQTAGNPPVQAYGVLFDVPGMADGDSAVANSIDITGYMHLIRPNENVLLTDSLTGLIIRLFSEEEILYRFGTSGIIQVSPFFVPNLSRTAP